MMVGVGAVAMVGIAGCGQEAGDAGDLGELQAVKAAIDSSGVGGAYSNQCFSSGVPLPSPWGQSTLGTADGQWTSRGSFDDSYITHGLTVSEYTMSSSSPPGICALNIRAGGTFDVICQGTNGKACFWEAGENFWPAHGINPPPPAVPQGFTIQIAGDNGIPATPNDARCTECHAGENAFITHVNPSNHPLNLTALSTWKPTGFYQPIVPADWVQNPGPAPSSQYPSQCVGCHVQSNAGRFPVLRALDFAGGGYCSILDAVVNLPASKGGMPPTIGECVPGSGPVTGCAFERDAAVRSMMAACGRAPTPPSTSSVTGLGPPYGVGTSQLSTKVHVSRSRPGEHQHFFFGATTTMPNPGCCTPHQNPHGLLSREDQINVWVYIPLGDSPREIMLQFFDGTNWWRAFWGEDLINFGARTRIGYLPAAGSWQVLSFQLLAIGVVSDLKFTGAAYTLYDGSAYWADTLFRSNVSPYNRVYVSQMWVKDALPAGATAAADGGDSWNFVTP